MQLTWDRLIKNESCFGTNIQLYTWILRGYSGSWVVVRNKYVHYLKLQICDLFFDTRYVQCLLMSQN